jgi:hypothetical protein
VLTGCGGDRPASDVGVLPATRSCGFQNFGKGWYLRATRSVNCTDAHGVFASFFSRECNRAEARSCSVGAYRCRFDYGDDVERVRCSVTGRLVAFRSLP